MAQDPPGSNSCPPECHPRGQSAASHAEALRSGCPEGDVEGLEKIRPFSEDNCLGSEERGRMEWSLGPGTSCLGASSGSFAL